MADVGEWEGHRDGGYPLRESTDEANHAVPTCRQAPKPLVCQLLMITPSREDLIEVGVREQARIWLSIKANDTWHTLNHAPRRVAAGELEANCTKNESWDL